LLFYVYFNISKNVLNMINKKTTNKSFLKGVRE